MKYLFVASMLLGSLSINIVHADDAFTDYDRVLQNDNGVHISAIPNDATRYVQGTLHTLYNEPLQLNSHSYQYDNRTRPNSQGVLQAGQYCQQHNCDN